MLSPPLNPHFFVSLRRRKGVIRKERSAGADWFLLLMCYTSIVVGLVVGTAGFIVEILHGIGIITD